MTIEQRIDQLRTLPDNWDDNGAMAMDSDMLTMLHVWLDTLPKKYTDLLDASDDITPYVHGTVGVNWSNGSKYLGVEFGHQCIGGYFTDDIYDHSNGVDNVDLFDHVDNVVNILDGMYK